MTVICKHLILVLRLPIKSSFFSHELLNAVFRSLRILWGRTQSSLQKYCPHSQPPTIHFKGYFLREAAPGHLRRAGQSSPSGSKNSQNCRSFDTGLTSSITDWLCICSFFTLLMSSRRKWLCLKHPANILCMKGLSSAGSNPCSHTPSPLSHCGPDSLFWYKKYKIILLLCSAFCNNTEITVNWYPMGNWVK